MRAPKSESSTMSEGALHPRFESACILANPNGRPGFPPPSYGGKRLIWNTMRCCACAGRHCDALAVEPDLARSRIRSSASIIRHVVFPEPGGPSIREKLTRAQCSRFLGSFFFDDECLAFIAFCTLSKRT